MQFVTFTSPSFLHVNRHCHLAPCSVPRHCVPDNVSQKQYHSFAEHWRFCRSDWGQKRCWFVVGFFSATIRWWGGWWLVDIGISMSKLLSKFCPLKKAPRSRLWEAIALSSPQLPTILWLQDASGSVGAAAAAEATHSTGCAPKVNSWNKIWVGDGCSFALTTPINLFPVNYYIQPIQPLTLGTSCYRSGLIWVLPCSYWSQMDVGWVNLLTVILHSLWLQDDL